MSTFGDRMSDAITRRAQKLASTEPKPKPATDPKDDKSIWDKAKDVFSK